MNYILDNQNHTVNYNQIELRKAIMHVLGRSEIGSRESGRLEALDWKPNHPLVPSNESFYQQHQR
jgi:hypothetical protein